MKKRRSSIGPEQLAFTLDAPAPAQAPADLAGLDRMAAAAVGRALKDDPRSRHEIAGAISALLDEDVSKAMLDAYASEAREAHNISFARMLALVAVTGRFDLLHAMIVRIGAGVLVGEEMLLAQLGNAKARKHAAEQEIRQLQAKVRPLARGRAE